jgi:hypothetical protein
MQELSTCYSETSVNFQHTTLFYIKMEYFVYVFSAQHKKLCKTVLSHRVKERKEANLPFHTPYAQVFFQRLTLIIKTPVRTRGFGSQRTRKSQALLKRSGQDIGIVTELSAMNYIHIRRLECDGNT